MLLFMRCSEYSTVLCSLRTLSDDFLLGRSGVSCCMAQRNLFDIVPQLRDGVRPPPFAAAQQRLHQLNTWLGPAGTVTPLHRDPYLNMLCQACCRAGPKVLPSEACSAARAVPLVVDEKQLG